MNWIDTHAHLDVADFDYDRETVIESAYQAGVKQIINIGATDGINGALRSIELTKKYDHIFCSVGIHPHDAGANIDFNQIIELAKQPKVVAIGETGLDFYRDWSPVDLQYKYFRLQIELAKLINKPLVIHSRESHIQCLDLINELKADSGVFHCFSYDWEFAKQVIDRGFLISIPGIVSFKNADQLRTTIKKIPLEFIMLETDCPYLAPIPYRGKRCEPAFMIKTAEIIANLLNMSLTDLAEQTCKNAQKLFSLPNISQASLP